MRKNEILLFALLLLASVAHPQLFGKNKVQYKGFRWEVIKTAHFEIFFYQGEEYLANFVADVAERTYDRFEADFRTGLSKTVPIIVYNSPNDFAQTNVISQLIEESVGGFTEIFKNRVVVPFTGSYRDLERVTIHELTHAFQFDVLYGTGPGALLSKAYQVQFPLWFAEGMAQFQSKEWDAESDMILRDVTINEKLVPIQHLEYLYGSYLVYVEGESILRFIEEKYGTKKIFELFHQLKTQRTMAKAMREIFGLTVAEFDQEWQKWLKLKYWSLAGEKVPLESYGSRLTNHVLDGSVLNVSPKLSPDGTKIAYISDKSGYSDLYLISALDGSLLQHLVKGERSSGFESIHPYRAGIGWSPDARTIVFIAKSHGKDIVHTMDVTTRKITHKLQFDLDGIYSPDWSPSGDEICFVGLKDGSSDLYLYDFREEKLRRLTNDRYDERDPSWAPEGDFIAFVSDRAEPEGQCALFTMGSDGSGITQVSFGAHLVSSPTWSQDGKTLCFLSDLDGTSNIYLLDVEENAYTRLTNALSGITAIHWAANRLVFSGFHDFGWDLYIVKNPRELMGEMASAEVDSPYKEKPDSDVTNREVKKYGLRFSPDWMVGGISYNTGYGLAGQSQIAISDILGNHRILIVSDLIQNIEESNFYLAYWYLPRRINYGFATFQQKYYYLLYGENPNMLSEREYGTAAFLSYPFDKFRRIDLEIDSYFREQTLYEYDYFHGKWLSYGWERRLVLVPYLSLVYDNTRFGMTGPVDGVRYNLTYGQSIGVSSSALRFSSAMGDFRKYWRLTNRYSVAARLFCAHTSGRDAERFWIGGSDNLRGHPDYFLSGYYVGFLNLELRCPFIDRFSMAFPLPIEIRSLRGVLFSDMGVACDTPSELVLTDQTNGGLTLKDLKLGFGVGIRFPISFFLVKLDFAKNTDFRHISRYTHVHFSLGSDF